MKVLVSYYAPAKEKRIVDEAMEMEEGATVLDLLHLLGLGPEDAGIIVVNAKSATYRQTLRDGDRATLIPALAGG